MTDATLSAARKPFFVWNGPRRWIAAVVLFGLVIGLSLPAALEGSLEIYLLVFAGLLIAGLFAMHRKRVFNDRACWILFVTFLTLYSVYPHYISLRISGLPWISPIRAVLAVLFFFWLYALRQSPDLAESLKRYVRENRLFFILLGTFIAAQVLSLVTARDVGQALTKFVLFQFTWTFPFLATLALVRTEQRILTLAMLFVAYAAAQCSVGFIEARLERLVWLDLLPPGFGADSEAMLRIIQGQFRAGGYRVQGSFTVSLIYAEFLVLMLPFAAFAFIEGRRPVIRVIGLITAIAIVPAQFLSGSRLGTVGTIVVSLSLLIIYVVRLRRTNKRSMVGPLLVLMLPFALAAFAAAYVASPRLQALTIGGGAQQASTDSRFEQFRMAVPRVAERPLFGHGIGLGAEALGFRSPSGVLTIDSYALSLILELGIVGFVSLVGMIVLTMVAGIRVSLQPGDGPNYLGGAVALSLAGFLATKLVLSQVETHVLVFVMMALVLVVRRQAQSAAAPVGAQATEIKAPSRGQQRAAPALPHTRRARPALPARARQIAKR